MAKKNNQKLKALCLVDILKKYTDEDHGLTMPEILEKLEARGISAERKSIYEDFDLLRTYGFDIGSFHRNGYRYNLQSRDFDIAELKMLVDAVQSSKFITPKKTRLLVEKISHLASDYQAKELQRNIEAKNAGTGYGYNFYNMSPRSSCTRVVTNNGTSGASEDLAFISSPKAIYNTSGKAIFEP